MKSGFWPLLAAAAVVAGLAGCGTLGKHYDEELSQAEPPPAPDFRMTIRISVDTKPTGAMISVNGSEVGGSPVSVQAEIDAAGRFVEALDVSADFSVINPIRGISHTVSTSFRRGDHAPRLLILARAADGGIQILDSAAFRK